MIQYRHYCQPSSCEVYNVINDGQLTLSHYDQGCKPEGHATQN